MKVLSAKDDTKVYTLNQDEDGSYGWCSDGISKKTGILCKHEICYLVNKGVSKNDLWKFCHKLLHPATYEKMLSLAQERDISNDNIPSLKEDSRICKFNEEDFYPLNIVLKGNTGTMSKAQSEEEGRVVPLHCTPLL